MGITDLPKLLRESKKPTSKPSELNDCVLGVDTSIWLNKAIFSSTEFCHSFCQVPSISVAHIIDVYMDSMLSLFDRNSIKLLFVLDGARNPLKTDTNKARKKSSDDAQNGRFEKYQKYL
jgi:5'-3' exonuclease